jgi:hypothetical protein
VIDSAKFDDNRIEWAEDNGDHSLASAQLALDTLVETFDTRNMLARSGAVEEQQLLTALLGDVPPDVLPVLAEHEVALANR